MCDTNYYELEPYEPPPEYDCRDCRNWKRSKPNEPPEPEPTKPQNNPRPNPTKKTAFPADQKTCSTCTSSWYDPNILTAPLPHPNPSWYDPETFSYEEEWPEEIPSGNQMIQRRQAPPEESKLPPDTALPNAYSNPPIHIRQPPPDPPPPNTYTEFQPYRYPDPPTIPPAILPKNRSCHQDPPPDLRNVLFDDIGLPEDTLGIEPYEPPTNICKTISINDEYEENVDSWFSDSPPPPPPPPCTQSWVEIAVEGQTITFTQQVDVALGYDINDTNPPPDFKYNVTGPIKFDNNEFGAQQYGQGKKGWFRCASNTPPPPIPGCTDPTASNYNPLATIDDGSCTYPTYPPPPADAMTPDASVRFSPSGMQMIKNITSVTASPRHDPDGISWISPAIWASASWDGTPLPSGLSKAQICQWFRPTAGGAYVVKGLRERFYQVNPFADNSNPTVKEIEDWNLEVIRHFRALVGVTTPIRHNPRLYLEARWSQERKRTQIWDNTYPITRPEYTGKQTGWSDGPCWLNGNPYDTASGHCGDSFFPFDTPDRTAYTSTTPYNGDTVKYPDLVNYTSRHAKAVGIISVNHNVPWSIKMALVISTWICMEGLGGHAAPYLGNRTEFGCSWWWLGGGVDEFRGKFAG